MTIQHFFEVNPSVAVAFSGGVDSALLVYLAKQYASRVKAYYVKTQFQPEFEYVDAKKICENLKVELQEIKYDIFSCDEIVQNIPDRCYFCKRAIMKLIREAAENDGFNVVVDGTNVGDRDDDRPGMRALFEQGILSPLKECGLNKASIRAMAKEAKLPVWNKPAYACLATRICTGERITIEALEKVEKAENYLFAKGFSDFRVRVSNDGALLQFLDKQLQLALKQFGELSGELQKLFSSVEIDNVPREKRE